MATTIYTFKPIKTGPLSIHVREQVLSDKSSVFNVVLGQSMGAESHTVEMEICAARDYETAIACAEQINYALRQAT